jgi:hypothetical protein
LRGFLPRHEIFTAFERGWAALQNGELLQAAEAEGFGVFVTTDQNLRYQQNLPKRRLAIVVLKTTSWPRIREHVDAIAAAIDNIQPSEYREVEIWLA